MTFRVRAESDCRFKVGDRVAAWVQFWDMDTGDDVVHWRSGIVEAVGMASGQALISFHVPRASPERFAKWIDFDQIGGPS